MSIQALHTSPPTKRCTRSWGGITWWEYQWAWDGNAASNAQSSFISAAKSVTTVSVVPVRVKAKGSNGSSLTYTFLDAPIPHSVPTSLWTLWALNGTRRDFPLLPSASRIVLWIATSSVKNYLIWMRITLLIFHPCFQYQAYPWVVTVFQLWRMWSASLTSEICKSKR